MSSGLFFIIGLLVTVCPGIRCGLRTLCSIITQVKSPYKEFHRATQRPNFTKCSAKKRSPIIRRSAYKNQAKEFMPGDRVGERKVTSNQKVYLFPNAFYLPGDGENSQEMRTLIEV